jgi:hypothetical protein
VTQRLINAFSAELVGLSLLLLVVLVPSFLVSLAEGVQFSTRRAHNLLKHNFTY